MEVSSNDSEVAVILNKSFTSGALFTHGLSAKLTNRRCSSLIPKRSVLT